MRASRRSSGSEELNRVSCFATSIWVGVKAALDCAATTPTIEVADKQKRRATNLPMVLNLEQSSMLSISCERLPLPLPFSQPSDEPLPIRRFVARVGFLERQPKLPTLHLPTLRELNANVASTPLLLCSP